MKVLMINVVCGIRSTGRICTDLAIALEKQGHEVKIAYGREIVPPKFRKYAIKIGKEIDSKLSTLHTRITDKHGFFNKSATNIFLEWAEKFDPDMLWLHNLHGYYINVEMLFKWIKERPNMHIKWTLHDCWPFTGHCAYFTLAKCERWKTGCYLCPQKHKYPSSYLKDNCMDNYKRKKTAFTGVENMTLITPSRWLANLVSESFLSEYPIEVIHNAVDNTIFKPTPSDFRERYRIGNKKIILGVASIWDERKGLKDFLQLANMLDETFVIVLVGLEKKQRRELPDNVIAISRTNSEKELAEIYSAADIFVNPSKEETFGLTTVEALACKTKTIVYKNTACEEIVNYFGGIAVEQGPEHIYKEILKRKIRIEDVV